MVVKSAGMVWHRGDEPERTEKQKIKAMIVFIMS